VPEVRVPFAVNEVAVKLLYIRLPESGTGPAPVTDTIELETIVAVTLSPSGIGNAKVVPGPTCAFAELFKMLAATRKTKPSQMKPRKPDRALNLRPWTHQYRTNLDPYRAGDARSSTRMASIPPRNVLP
jgi:hypothetical protein